MKEDFSKRTLPLKLFRSNSKTNLINNHKFTDDTALVPEPQMVGRFDSHSQLDPGYFIRRPNWFPKLES